MVQLMAHIIDACIFVAMALNGFIDDRAETQNRQQRQSQVRRAEANGASSRPRPISGTKTFSSTSDEANTGVLLQSLAVQREIGLTKDQAESLDKLYLSQFQRNNPILEEYRDSTGNQERRNELEVVLSQQSTQFRSEVRGQLNPRQSQRLLEISIQHAGIRAFLLPEIVEALNIPPFRQDELKSILVSLDEQMALLMSDIAKAELSEFASLSKKDWREYKKSPSYLARRKQHRSKQDAMRDSAYRRVIGLLTHKQRAFFEKMKGEPFNPEKHRRPDDSK